MTAFHNGQGLHVAVEYAPLSDAQSVTSDVTTGRASPQTQWVVKSMTTTDDFEDSASTSTYHYWYPKWSPDERGDWAFRGFEQVRSFNPRGGVVEERYGYNVDYTGRLISTLTYLEDQPGEDFTVSIADTEWRRYTLFGGAIETFHPTITRSWTCANEQIEQDCRARTAMDANNGYVRDEQVWTALASTSSGDPTALLYEATRKSHQSDDAPAEGDRYFDTTYFVLADASHYRVRPTSQVSTVLEGVAYEVFAKTETLWDEKYRVPVEERVYFDETEYAATLKGYDDQSGVLEKLTKPEQAASGGPHASYDYDAQKVFVTATENELGHRTLTTYEPGTGALVSTRGPNAYACAPSCTGGYEERRTDVDGLGRPIATYVPRNAVDHYELRKVTETSYVDTPAGVTPTSITTRRLISTTRRGGRRTEPSSTATVGRSP